VSRLRPVEVSSSRICTDRDTPLNVLERHHHQRHKQTLKERLAANTDHIVSVDTHPIVRANQEAVVGNMEYFAFQH
jgi:hypothetical protein